MASIQQRKAIMAAVLIHHEAREILSIPDSVKTYADLELWIAEDGKNVPEGLQTHFKAIFEKHFQEHEDVSFTAIAANEQSITQNTAHQEKQPPIQGQLVDTFGYPAARQRQLMGMTPGQHAGPQSHDDPPAARARALGHRRTDARDLGQGYPVGARRGLGLDRATSFGRQMMAFLDAKDEQDPTELATRAEEQGAGSKGDMSVRFQAHEKQDGKEEEEAEEKEEEL